MMKQRKWYNSAVFVTIFAMAIFFAAERFGFYGENAALVFVAMLAMSFASTIDQLRKEVDYLQHRMRELTNSDFEDD